MRVSRWIILRMGKFSDKSCRENENMDFKLNKPFAFGKSCRFWDNAKKYGRVRQVTDDNIIQRVGFACWVTKATNTLRIYKLIVFSTAKTVPRMRLNITFICTLADLFFTHKATFRWTTGFKSSRSRIAGSKFDQALTTEIKFPVVLLRLPKWNNLPIDQDSRLTDFYWHHTSVIIRSHPALYMQWNCYTGVPGGMCQTSGGCSLC